MTISNIQNVMPTAPVKINSEIDFKSKNGNSTPVEPAQRVDTFEKQNDVSKSVTYEPPKKLSKEQVDEINRQRHEATMKFVADSVEQTVTNQASEASGISSIFNGFEITTETSELLTEIFGSLENALPAPATTAEGALENVSEGGAYSIEAVSERIMMMATAFAGDNEQLMADMQQAVKDGFKAAGFDAEARDESDMPEITGNTYDNVMSEFDKLLNPEEEQQDETETEQQNEYDVA